MRLSQRLLAKKDHAKVEPGNAPSVAQISDAWISPITKNETPQLSDQPDKSKSQACSSC